MLTTSSVRMGEPMFAPDGRWFAFQSGESSRGEIFVQPFQANGRKVQISIAGGLWPTWSKSRREIVYLADGRLMVVPYSIDGDVFRPERARPWSPTELVPRGIARPFDLHPDGERVAGGILLTAQAQETNSVVLALNWFDELNRRVPHPR